jgi:diketogulonate reductase-like aldo/keto reductase
VPRRELFLTSKCPGGGYNKTYSCALQSLVDFGTDHLDLLLLHFPDGASTGADWRALEAVRAQGKARAIGVSNFGRADMAALLQVCRCLSLA